MVVEGCCRIFKATFWPFVLPFLPPLDAFAICMTMAAIVRVAIAFVAAVHVMAAGTIGMYAIAVLAGQQPLGRRNSLLCVCCAVALGKHPEGVQDRPVSSAAAAHKRARISEMHGLHIQQG